MDSRTRNCSSSQWPPADRLRETGHQRGLDASGAVGGKQSVKVAAIRHIRRKMGTSPLAVHEVANEAMSVFVRSIYIYGLDSERMHVNIGLDFLSHSTGIDRTRSKMYGAIPPVLFSMDLTAVPCKHNFQLVIRSERSAKYSEEIFTVCFSSHQELWETFSTVFACLDDGEDPRYEQAQMSASACEEQT